VRNHFIQVTKPTLAAVLVGVVLLLDAMAACPALHEAIHHDAGKPDHECAVTMFAHGKVDSPVCEVIVLPPTSAVEINLQHPISIFSPVIADLPPGRAPPAVSSSQV
jgi:hypothetical protein